MLSHHPDALVMALARAIETERLPDPTHEHRCVQQLVCEQPRSEARPKVVQCSWKAEEDSALTWGIANKTDSKGRPAWSEIVKHPALLGRSGQEARCRWGRMKVSGVKKNMCRRCGLPRRGHTCHVSDPVISSASESGIEVRQVEQNSVKSSTSLAYVLTPLVHQNSMEGNAVAFSTAPVAASSAMPATAPDHMPLISRSHSKLDSLSLYSLACAADSTTAPASETIATKITLWDDSFTDKEVTLACTNKG